MAEETTKEIVKANFTEYLTAKGHRKTEERYAILDRIYSMTGHFDMEELYNSMSSGSFRVSRATVYNTIELLLDCKLVMKHQFGKNRFFYEKSYENDNHHHLICEVCEAVRDIKSTDIDKLIKMKRIAKFKPTHYCLYVYGICSTCAAAKRSKGIKK